MSYLSLSNTNKRRSSLHGLNSEMCCNIDGETIQCHVNELIQKQVIGHGAFGMVFEMLHKPSLKVMAVKKLKLITSDADKQKSICRDLDISKLANSQYTVRFYGALLHEGDVWICMEIMDLSLERFYLQAKELGQTIPEEFLSKVTFSVLSGLIYLKETLKIIHRDVKPSNILINSDGVVRICDFGISGPLIDSIAQTKDAGCKAYMAPERIDPRLSSSVYDTRSDVWSLGITLVELGNCCYPYKLSANPFALVEQIVKGEPPKLAKGKYSVVFENFIQQCLEKEKHHRSKYKDLINHPFILKANKLNFDMKRYATEIIEEYRKKPNIYENEYL